jgi:hypothetical protein
MKQEEMQLETGPEIINNKKTKIKYRKITRTVEKTEKKRKKMRTDKKKKRNKNTKYIS